MCANLLNQATFEACYAEDEGGEGTAAGDPAAPAPAAGGSEWLRARWKGRRAQMKKAIERRCCGLMDRGRGRLLRVDAGGAGGGGEAGSSRHSWRPGKRDWPPPALAARVRAGRPEPAAVRGRSRVLHGL